MQGSGEGQGNGDGQKDEDRVQADLYPTEHRGRPPFENCEDQALRRKADQGGLDVHGYPGGHQEHPAEQHDQLAGVAQGRLQGKVAHEEGYALYEIAQHEGEGHLAEIDGPEPPAEKDDLKKHAGDEERRQRDAHLRSQDDACRIGQGVDRRDAELGIDAQHRSQRQKEKARQVDGDLG